MRITRQLFYRWSSLLFMIALTILPGRVNAQSLQTVSEAMRRGHWQQALTALDAFEASLDEATRQPVDPQILLKRAEILLASGKPNVAMTLLNAALGTPRSPHTASQQATLLGLMGVAQLKLGHGEQALHYQQDSLTAAQQSSNPELLAVALNNLGNALQAQGHDQQALQRYQASAEQAQQTNNLTLAAKAWTNAARLSQSLQQPPASITAFLQRAEQAATQSKASHDQAMTLISLAQLHLQRIQSGQFTSHSVQQTHEVLRKAIEVSRVLDNPLTLSYALGYSGHLYHTQARFKEALALAEQATFIAGNSHRPELLYRWQWLSGRILNAQGKNDAAINAYQLAIDTLQPIRFQLIKQQYRSGQPVQARIGLIYFELADLLLQRYDRVADKQRAEQDLIQARKTVERVKSLELEDYFQDDCVAALQAKTRGVDNLALHTAALYPVLLPDRLELLLSLPSGMKKASVPLGRSALTKQVRTLRLQLEKRTTREYLPQAQALYQVLIQPILPWLNEHAIETLVFIPDGALRTIPLAALHDGHQFLIEQFAIATSPGLTLTDPQSIQRQQAQFLLSGLTEGVQGFAPLPFVEEELQQIAGLYQSTVLKDQAFQVKTLQKALAGMPFRVVHLASHGQFKPDIRETFLLTYDGKISMNTLEHFLGLSRYREHAVELLTLSACQTAAGDDRAALGLAGIAIKAGARSALASLWFINDRASSALVSEFYRQLQDPGLSKAKALQRAQQSLLNQRRYRHPALWAPFLLIGNWL